MAKDARRDLPTGNTPKLRAQATARVPVTTPDGTPVYRVRLWDPVLKRQIERTPRAWTRRPSCWAVLDLNQ
jgi:hypothetical protein